jgi:ABC-type transporter Mla MlaB component
MRIFGTYIATVFSMVLRIDKSDNSEFVIFTLSGRIENETITELQEILALAQTNQKIALDLKDVKLVDRRSVEYLEECETQGVELWNCPAYLREWIVRARGANGR